jgi:secreted trypsin-like serine protease
MVCISISMTLFVSSIKPAISIQGGDLALGDNRIVSWMDTMSSRNSSCSAALLRERVVVTAAHCVTQSNSELLNLNWDTSVVALPGVDIKVDDFGTRISVKRIVRASGYIDVWNPNGGDTRTQVDDIAFLFLTRPVIPGYTIPVATLDEVSIIKKQGLVITHLGYGFQASNSVDGKPYRVDLLSNQKGSGRYGDKYGTDWKTISSDETGFKALCPGDSGSPWYSNINGIEKIVAVTVGASGCGGSGRNGTIGTVIAPYLSLLDSEWNLFVKEEEIASATTTTTSTTTPTSVPKTTTKDLAKNIIESKCPKVGAKRKVGTTTLICKVIAKSRKWSR